MTRQELELPKGWVETELENLGKDKAYPIGDGDHGKIKPEMYSKEGIPYIRVGDMGWGELFLENMVFIPKDVHDANQKSNLEPGDIIIAKTGATIGKCAIIPSSIESANTTSSVGKVSINSVLTLPKWILYYFLSASFKKYMWSVSNKTAQPGFNIENLKKFNIPLAPLNEQKRIVSKIEELFSKINSTKQSLEYTRPQLEQYRISLLKSAFEGKLTEKWRDTNDVVDSVSKLLEQKQNKNKKIQKTEIDLSALPVIPETWAWVNFNQILEDEKNAMKAGPFGSSLKKEFYVSDGYKIYGQEQVIRGDPEYGDYFIDEARFQLLKSNEVKPGDLLISLVGTVGKTLVLPDKIKKGILNPRLIKISLDKQIVDVQFIQMYFESTTAKFYFKLASHGGTMDILNMGMLKKLPIPLPVLNEQKEIREKIEQGFSLIENSQRIVNSTLQTLKTMRMSVLKQAFQGKLVPQDPNDEPASVLLERIKKEKLKIRQ